MSGRRRAHVRVNRYKMTSKKLRLFILLLEMFETFYAEDSSLKMEGLMAPLPAQDRIMGDAAKASPAGPQAATEQEPGGTETWTNTPYADFALLRPIRPYALVNFTDAVIRTRMKRVLPQPVVEEFETPKPILPFGFMARHPSLMGNGPQPIISEAPEPSRISPKSSKGPQVSLGYGLTYGPDSYVRVGLTNADNTAPLGYRYKPSDMAICVGGGYMIQGVNAVLTVRNATTGSVLKGPLSIIDFFGQPVSNKGKISFDPRCEPPPRGSS
eukprot:jgi/Botrbrau1/20433/Bobra.0616s0001.1